MPTARSARISGASQAQIGPRDSKLDISVDLTEAPGSGVASRRRKLDNRRDARPPHRLALLPLSGPLDLSRLLPSARPWIAAHRGAQPEIENTLPSFARALAEGADLLECDAQLTGDEKLVVFHDKTLERLARSDRRRVAHMTLAELKRISLHGAAAGSRPGRVLSLSELFASLPRGTWLNVDVKRYEAPIAELAAAVERSLGHRPNVIVSSFDFDLLRSLRSRLPELPIAPLAQTFSPGLALLARELDASALHLADPPADEALGGGLPVLVFTVNDPRRARELLHRGVAGLFTDRPGPLRRALAALGAGPGGVV